MTSRLGRSVAVIALSLLAARAAWARDPFSNIDAKLSALEKAENDLARCKPRDANPVNLPPPPVHVEPGNIPMPPKPLSPAEQKLRCFKDGTDVFFKSENFRCLAAMHPDMMADYYQCRAVARNDPRDCAAMSSEGIMAKQAKTQGDVDCHVDVAKLLLGRALIRHDEKTAASLCPQTLEYSPSNLKEKLCPILLAHNGDAAGVCAALKAAGISGSGECEPWAAASWGGPECSRLTQASIKPLCGALQKYRAAERARSPQRCGGSSVCRALMGAPEASCGRGLAPIERQYCSAKWDLPARQTDYQGQLKLWKRGYDAAVLDAEVKQTARQRAIYDAKARLAQAQPAVDSCTMLVDGVRKGLDDAIASLDHIEPKSIGGFEERRHRIERMQTRLTELRRRALTPVNKGLEPRAKRPAPKGKAKTSEE